MSIIKINKIEINGTKDAYSTVTSRQKYIEICIEGDLEEPITTDVMLIFKDKDGMPVATFANGHHRGEISHLPKGPFSINKKIQLPPIVNRGLIKVDLFFHHPMVEFQLKAPSCCTLDFEGYQTEFGKVCGQDLNGFIGLLDY